MTPEVCPTCGADVPPNAKACPECGSDESTGWSEKAADQAYASNLGIPDDDFNYDEYVKEEFGGKKASSGGKIWWVVCVIAAILLILFFAGVLRF